MTPYIMLVIGCLGMSLTLTYLIHSLYRPMYLKYRMERIRRRLSEGLKQEGRWDDPEVRDAFVVFSRRVELVAEIAPLLNTIECGIFLASYGAGTTSGTEEPKEISEPLSELAATIFGYIPYDVFKSSQAFQDALYASVMAIIFHVLSSPGMVLTLGTYIGMARLARHPKYWILAPLRAFLTKGMPGGLGGVPAHS